MPLNDILRKVAAGFGASDLATNPNQRAFLVDKINSAAKEIWASKDLPGSLREIAALVTPGKIVGLPSFVYALRAMRESVSNKPWTLNDLRPRYHLNSWATKWNNWRFIGYGAVQLEIGNQAPVNITIDTADPDLVITVVGSTLTSRRVADSFTMSSIFVAGTVSFTQIDSIQANKLPAFDVTINDVEGNILAILYADTRETRYLLVDVSSYPSSSDGWQMDILYKMHLPVMYNDTDIFPVPDYDDIIAVKTLQLLAEGQEGKESRAAMAYQKAEKLMDDRAEDQTGPVQKKVRFAANPLLGRFAPWKWNMGRRMRSTRYGR